LPFESYIEPNIMLKFDVFDINIIAILLTIAINSIF